MNDSLSDVAVVILNYNTVRDTINLVNHILKFNSGIFIIVVDNNSTDSSWDDLVHEFNDIKHVKLFRNYSNGGYAKGNNIGISLAKSINGIKFVAIVNPDVIFEKKTLEEMRNVLSDEEIGLVTTRTIYCGEERKYNECAWKHANLWRWIFDVTIFGTLLRKGDFVININNIMEKIRGYYPPAYYADTLVFVDVVQGCFFLTKLQTILDVRGFDEGTFLYYEEDILAKKIEKINKRNAVLSKYWIEHNHKTKNKELKDKNKKIFHVKQEYSSRKYYLDKYCELNKLLKLVIKSIWMFDYTIKCTSIRLLCW